MIRPALLACAILYGGGASADVLADADGRWRGAGTAHGFDGIARDVRCRLDVETTETGRIDLNGTCAGVEGSQNFRLFLRPAPDGTAVQGGGLGLTGDEAGPVLSGDQAADGLTLRGEHDGSAIAITLRREGDVLHMISVRTRGAQVERSEITYRRASVPGGS